MLDANGRIIAGSRGPDGRFLDAVRLATEGAAPPLPGTRTTLCVVATDAPLDCSALEALAQAGSTGMARRISPAHTPFDGDVTFAASTAEDAVPAPPELRLALATLAAQAVATAIERAARAATGTRDAAGPPDATT